jgi:ADP-ribose pyrophosphatase
MEKPNAARLGWHVRSSQMCFDRDVFQVREDALEVNRKQNSYAFVVRPAAVIIVPVSGEGKIITLRQYRYPIDEWCVEVPAGGTHDTGDESLQQVAREELRQEVGATAEMFTHVTSFYTSPSLTSENCHVFLAEKVRLTKKPETETTEEIRIELRAVTEVLELARQGKMKNGPCALAVLLCEPLLRQRKYIS